MKKTFEQTITTVTALPCACGGGYIQLSEVKTSLFRKPQRIYQCFLCGERCELPPELWPTVQVKVVDSIQAQLGPWPLWAMSAQTRFVNSDGGVWYTEASVTDLEPDTHMGVWRIKDEVGKEVGLAKAGHITLPIATPWTQAIFKKEEPIS
jgi:hypothetical protein